MNNCFQNFLTNYTYYIHNNDLISNLDKQSNNIKRTKFTFTKYKISIIKIKYTSYISYSQIIQFQSSKHKLTKWKQNNKFIFKNLLPKFLN